jgi:hypothetical protein
VLSIDAHALFAMAFDRIVADLEVCGKTYSYYNLPALNDPRYGELSSGSLLSRRNDRLLGPWTMDVNMVDSPC